MRGLDLMVFAVADGKSGWTWTFDLAKMGVSLKNGIEFSPKEQTAAETG